MKLSTEKGNIYSETVSVCIATEDTRTVTEQMGCFGFVLAGDDDMYVIKKSRRYLGKLSRVDFVRDIRDTDYNIVADDFDRYIELMQKRYDILPLSYSYDVWIAAACTLVAALFTLIMSFNIGITMAVYSTLLLIFSTAFFAVTVYNGVQGLVKFLNLRKKRALYESYGKMMADTAANAKAKIAQIVQI